MKLTMRLGVVSKDITQPIHFGPISPSPHNIAKPYTPSPFLYERDLVEALRLRSSFFKNHNMFIYGPWLHHSLA